jgi:hypothetical protein
MGKRRIAPFAVGLVLVVGAACTSGSDIQSKVKQIGGVPLSSGTAHVDVTGAEEVSYDAPLTQGQVGTAVTALVYKTESNDLFSITGLGVSGPSKTSTNLALTLVAGDLSADSVEGECTVTINPGESDTLSGTATCSNLDSNQGTVDVKARFSGAP